MLDLVRRVPTPNLNDSRWQPDVLVPLLQFYSREYAGTGKVYVRRLSGDPGPAGGARGIRRAALSRRDGARVLAGARPTGQSRTLNFAANIERLEREGFAPREARRILMALARYALGWALGEQAQRRPSDAADADFEFGLQAMLQGLAAGRAQPLRAVR